MVDVFEFLWIIVLLSGCSGDFGITLRFHISPEFSKMHVG